MKKLLLRYTVPIEVDVPDDFPITPEEIARIGEWQCNDYSDGRHPFSTEQLFHAALDCARSDINRAVDDSYRRRVDAWSPPRGSGQHLDACNKLVERCLSKMGYLHLVDGGTIEVGALSHPLGARYCHFDTCLVFCRADCSEGERGEYELATRTVFESREGATAYAKSIAAAREPLVVKVSLGELRVGEDRGRLDYWVAPPKVP